MHPLLQRLFDENVGPDAPVPPGWRALLEGVDDALTACGVPPAGPEAPREGESTFRALAETIAAAIFVYQGTRFRYVNAAGRALTGYPADELMRMNFWDIVHPDDRETVRRRGLARLRGETVPASYEIRFLTRDGEERWGELSSGVIEYEGSPAVLGTVFDVTGRKRTEAELRRLVLTFENLYDAVIYTDPEGRITGWNPAASQLLGYTREEVLGKTPDLWLRPGGSHLLTRDILDALDREGRWSGEAPFARKDGSRGVAELVVVSVLDERGERVGMLGVSRDVTERKRFEEQLAHGAFHDALTGLPNRTLFLDRLAQAVERARRREDLAPAVLFLALDRFKVINDSLGHDIGDDLLRAVGARLAEVLRPDDTAARFGGDEFTVLLDNVESPVTATHVAQRILKSLSRPFQLHHHEVYTSASVGIALYTGSSTTAEELLRNAGTALGRAKARGRARYEVFDRAMHAEAMARLQMEIDLRPARERGELRLVYQPVVALLEGGAVTGFEALLRWEHPSRGAVSPAQFVPVAEETGLIVPIGEWVLVEACRQLRSWRDHFPGRSITMGVNLSPRQFARPELVDRVQAILDDTGVEPSSLRLEITESLLIEHTDPTAVMLARLKELGVGLSMDDFGTGYSSLSYLHRFPLDMLKIDRSFVGRVGRGDGAEPVVRTITTLAHNLGLAVVAEGVEAPEQLEELRELRCEYGQGFLFAPPMEPAEVERMLAADPRW